MPEVLKSNYIPKYKRPAIWISAAVAIGLIAAFATSGPKKASAEPINEPVKFTEPVKTLNIQAPSLTDPKPEQQQNATATNESKAIRTGDVNNHGKGNVTIINGNQYNITTNPQKPVEPEPELERIPPTDLPTKPVKVKTPCDDENVKHIKTVAKWQKLFN